MSLSDLDVKAIYNANGVTTAFAIPFVHIFNDSAETIVYVFDPAADPVVHDLQVEGALQDYTLTGASPPGTPFDTHVTFNVAPASGLQVMVVRKIDLTQPEDLNATSTVNLATIERMGDRITAIAQQLDEMIKRAPKFRQSYTTVTDPLLPVPAAGLFLKWNADEDGLENANPILNSSSGTIGLPASSTDNAIPKWDGTNADTLQDSGVTISDANIVTAVGLILSSLTANRAIVTDGSKNLISIAVTATELGYVSGVTSAIQTQIDSKQPTGNYITALTTDVTAVGPGSVAATIANDAVTNAKAANMATQTIKGRTTAGTGDPEDLTATQATAILNVMVGDSGSGGTKGLAPAPGAGDAAANKFLNADGTYKVASGGGGGGALSWIERAASPTYASDNDLDNYIYADAMSQYLYTQVRVPNGYNAGSQVNLRIPFYSAITSGTVLIQTLATLIRAATDAVTSTTNQRTSANTAVTLSAGTANEPQSVVCDLSSSIGQINGVAIAAGDIIKVRLTRDTGTDTAAGDVYVLPYAGEVTFS